MSAYTELTKGQQKQQLLQLQQQTQQEADLLLLQQQPPKQQMARERFLYQQDVQLPLLRYQQQQHPQLTILLLTTFKDIGRALMSITSVKTHLAPELIHEGILLTPWTMVLKLTVSSLISTRHYLVLDSDVLMVRHVGPQQAHWLFPEPGKALYQPQRRKVHHRWWNTTEAILGLGGCLSADPDRSVFGVTPALLATDISASAARYWDEHLGGGSRLRALGELLPRRRPFLTEYCSYHLVAECVMGNGTLNEYHALPRHRRLLHTAGGGGNGGDDMAPPGVLYRGLWQSRSWLKSGGRATVCKDCVFLVVQSDTRVPEGKVVGHLEEVFL
ncbi:hypothetical protein VOLCADRAFT_91898 [Volvox carteri f. nagariensis]|uniref:Uncharacterized protein n=1 Tax=Volvox carteri f. nagariensis TaxID=3068 RepID=D8TY88_VOLCA|nr:uncharacterized protein VOLCADRAFT_91898 [Volvox carteri f. nagariensis]EFJ47509.1 hypothetical protein VOLCADRAFT_91898 [Volvox carteri f. nagariensis]|eukprot:XP_002951333.1 hypothetical protein VOLCADRAFT_91898 [Volvox carteri f. nagariensis]